jgi:hypothetical protein
MRVKLKDGRYCWIIEEYSSKDIIAVRFVDGWGWITRNMIEEEVV